MITITFEELLRAHQQEPKAWIMNPARQKDFMDAYNTLREIVLAEDENAKIECGMHELDIGAGVIRIETYWLTVRETEKFASAISKADNLEIYPMVKGKLRMHLMFHGVHNRIK